MKQLTGELFHLSGGITMLIHNEQEMQFHDGQKIVFEKRIYAVIAVIPPSRPDGKWSIRIEEEKSSRDTLRLCKCFSPPPGSPCIQNEVYEWTVCIDGKIVYLDSGDTWTEGDFEFFKFFSVMTGWA